MVDNNNDLLTLEQVYTSLGIAYTTLNRYIKQGMIPVVVITRNKRFIRKTDLDKFIREHTGVYESQGG